MAESSIIKSPKWFTSGREEIITTTDIGFTAAADGLCCIVISGSNSANTAYLYLRNSNNEIICAGVSVSGAATSLIFPIQKGVTYSYGSGTNLKSPIYRTIYYFN